MNRPAQTTCIKRPAAGNVRKKYKNLLIWPVFLWITC
jgi:hypothetical protein